MPKALPRCEIDSGKPYCFCGESEMERPEKVAPVTQRLIAENVGVSQRLVAYALNGNGRMGEETRKKVLDEAKRLGYRPNRAAQALVTGRSSSIIALCLPHLATAFCNEVVRVVEREARAHQYGLIILDTGEMADGSWKTFPLTMWPVDGAIVVDPVRMSDESQTPDALKLVFMGISFTPDNSTPYDFVHVDLTEAVENALRHLNESGARRIAYLAPVNMMKSQEIRYALYQKHMSNIGQPAELITFPESEKVRPEASNALQQHIEAHGHPDALLCGNDEIAIGAYRALRKMGLRIPEDVAVIGCDGIQDSEDLYPSLTTLSIPIEEMGKCAWNLLMERLQTPSSPPQRISMKATLIHRESTTTAQ